MKGRKAAKVGDRFPKVEEMRVMPDMYTVIAMLTVGVVMGATGYFIMKPGN